MATEVLRRGVHRGVGAERERLLQVRSGESVVDDHPRVLILRRARNGLDVDDREQRVGRGLDPDHAGLGPPRRFERAQVAQVTGRPRDPMTFVYTCDKPVGAAVRVVRDDQMVARVECAQDGILGREAARERESVPRVLERRDARLHRGTSRVAAARIFVAAVLSDRVLGECRRQADRRHDRTRAGVRLMTGVDRARFEAVAGGPAHGDVLMRVNARRGSRARRNGSARRSDGPRRGRGPTARRRGIRRRAPLLRRYRSSASVGP